jgi:CoA:oxalate CoA-transferase
VASERTFVDLGRAAGREDWLTDPRFAVYGDRRRNWHLLVAELEQWSRRLTTVECQAAFDRFGVPCSPYRTVEEAMADPQLAHRQAFGESRDAGGLFRALNPPFRFSASPAGIQPFVAALGEHGDQVLAEAGYSPQEVEELKKSRVLGG